MNAVASAAKVLTFDGYDPSSPTLERGQMSGRCLRSLVPAEYGTCYDDELAVHSGDFVVITCRDGAGAVRRMVKQLRCSHGGLRWWGYCDDAPFEIGKRETVSTDRSTRAPPS